MAYKKTLQVLKMQISEVHGDLYDYSKVVYEGSHKKVKIICKEHGVFEQTPCNHLKGQGCKIYANIGFSEKYKKTKEQYLKDVEKVHGDRYDYSKVDYKGAHTKISIICKTHKEFKQLADAHLKGQGCPKCNIIERSKNINSTTEEFTEKSKEVHSEFYNYEKVIYTKAINKVIITCPLHGDFEQVPSNHLSGYGCYSCGKERSNKKLKENPTSWSYTNWQKAGERSKCFDSFKCYIIKCWNNEEEFFKIGKTFLTLEKRFPGKKEMPYDSEIVKFFEGEAREISELENKLQKQNKDFKYTPKIKFGGYSECFKQVTQL